jgi:hypothetical protein
VRFRAIAFLLLVAGCGRPDPPASSHDRMVAALRKLAAKTDDEHDWIGDREARELKRFLAELPSSAPPDRRWMALVRLGLRQGFLGDFDGAVARLAEAEAMLPSFGGSLPDEVLYPFRLGSGLVWLRLGEVRNCCARNRPESCILPLRDGAIHVETEGSRRALAIFAALADRFPERAAPRWLLNLAAMTLGNWPDAVAERHRLPANAFESGEPFPRFPNVAGRLGLDFRNLAGSLAVDDFDGDGFLDLFLSSWDPRAQLRYFRNDGRGGFAERTSEAGLSGILGGANLVQADFDNDGDLDLLVLRGTWQDARGRHPKSLLRNDGGRFVDVAFDAGLGAVHYPTETAAWADFDGDGDLDLYVGNEHGEGLDAPSQLFRNDGGSFVDVAAKAGVENRRYAKGVTWGDYDNDGDPDLYVSNLRREANRLYRNNGDGTFVDVAPPLGVTRPYSGYAAWFWDANNDGHLDLYATSYHGGIETVAASYFGATPPDAELACLYLGDGKGGFKESAAEWGLTRPAMAMGANFGDLDGDGWLDFYLGTGYPEYEALMPNVMYRNRGGRGFVDVSFAGGFAHLQKGHGVAFADFDHDGDPDVFQQMGGAYRGDEAANVVYENPGFGKRWIALKLVGAKANRCAIGARVRIDVDDGGPRSIHRHVSSGGSFGANPLRLEIGLGGAEKIRRLEIAWPGSKTVQIFADVAPGRLLEVVEGRDELRPLLPPK